MFFFGRKKKKREAERLAAEQAAEQARLAEEMKKAEAMREAELAQKKEAEALAAKEQEAAQIPAVTEAPAEEPVEEPAAAEARSNGKFEIKRASDGRYMFNVRAGNTQVIASSQMYSSMAACKNGIASVGANAPVAAIEDQTLQTLNEEKCPKFQIYYDKAGQYRFNLIAKNGNNILSCTQGYRQKSSCKNGIKSVITNAYAPTEILKTENK